MNEVRTHYCNKEMPPDILEKLKKSTQEAQDLTMRDIRCPYCGYIVDKVFSDVSGHKQVYCQKCKNQYFINLGYFRRQHKLPYFKISFPDKPKRQER